MVSKTRFWQSRHDLKFQNQTFKNPFVIDGIKTAKLEGDTVMETGIMTFSLSLNSKFQTDLKVFRTVVPFFDLLNYNILLSLGSRLG